MELIEHPKQIWVSEGVAPRTAAVETQSEKVQLNSAAEA